MLKQRIRELRANIKFTQAKLGDYLGVSQQAVGKWETGAAEPDIRCLIEMSKLFKVPVDYLLGQTESFEIKGEAKYSVLIQKYDQLNPDDRGKVLGYIDGILASNDTNPELSATIA